mgnify:CR=1 FL=1
MTSQRVYFIGMAGFLVIYILFMIRQPNVSFKNGDILFQDLDCGAPCEAIEAVTQGYNGSQLSHCAIITRAGSSFSNTIVAEAIGEKVTTITLEEFLNRSNKVLVGRLKKEHSQLIPDVIKHIEENLIGKPYDFIFDITDDTYYCSEIIYEGLQAADNNQEIMQLNPMTFNKPGTNTPFIHWIDYYEELNHEIPEGKLGLNPGGMSRSEGLEIIYMFEKPSGYFE